MSEIGEGAAAVTLVETAKKGKIKVSVRNSCTGERIPDASITVSGKSKQSDDQGEALFEELNIGSAKVKVNKHFKEADYKTFITHKPKVTLSWDAKSSANDLVLVEEGKESKVRIEIKTYRVVETVVFCRIHQVISNLEYGHWWILVGDKSYGWWPKQGELRTKDTPPPEPPTAPSASAGVVDNISYMAKMATYYVSLASFASPAIAKTFSGVEGILNGDEEHKRRERDPHHDDWMKGKTDEDYHPVIVDCRTDVEIHKAIRDFALAYSGAWSWRFEFGRNCHTFQKDAMKQLKLDKVKEI